MDIKVLGPGCAKCRATYALLEQVARDRNVAITLTKVEDMREIVDLGILATPGVVIDGKVVHAGGIPSRAKAEEWLRNGASASATAAPAGGCKGGAKTGCCG